MNRWLKSDVALLVWRLMLVYLALSLCRVAFLIYNSEAIGHIAWSETWSLFRGSLLFDTATLVYTNALFIVLSLMPFRFRHNRWYRGTMFWYYIIINSISVAVNLADAVYFRYTAKRFTADEIFFAGNDNSFQLILKFMGENWYLVVVFVAIVAVLILFYGRKIAPQTLIQNTWVYFGINLLLLATASVLCVGGIRGGFSRMTRPITMSNAMQYTSSPAKANLILSNPFCIIRTAGSAGKLSYEKYYSPEELSEIYTPYHYPNPNDTIRPKNIVVFILESFSAEHSALLNPELYGKEPGYTPFLDSLMREGYTFTRAFANGHRSIEALPSILGSIPSFKTPFVLMPQSIGRNCQLPQILSDKGYPTLFFNGSGQGSMGFEAYVRSAGVKDVHSRKEYEAARGKGDFDGYWGIWDMPFIDYMGEVLGGVAQPFFASVFTLSSHHPFVVPKEYEYLPEGRTKIHRGIQYTDLSIRDFFDKYGEQNWFRNSVFVFVADHVSSEIYAPQTNTLQGRSHIIQFIYTPDGSVKGIDSHISQQIDLMPTLMNFVPNAEPYFGFGRDALGESERKPAVVKYNGGEYIAMTDSVTIFFDEKRITEAYAASDIFHENAISTEGNAEVATTERLLKAVIQQYYDHIERMDYTLPAGAE